MKHTPTVLLAAAFLSLAFAQNTNPQNPSVPRGKIDLICTENFFKTERKNFLLQDESYDTCKLRVPLQLSKRWPGRRSYYIVPRVAATLHALGGKDNQGRWFPLSPLANPGPDPFHRVLDSKGFEAVELSGRFGNLSEKTTQTNDKPNVYQPDVVSAGGKLTVCVAPVYRNETPCVTFDIAARFKIYKR